jgi:hypothetical protein
MPVRAPVVNGNFDEIKAYIETRRKEVAELKPTDKNRSLLVALKKEAVAYRTSFTKLWSEIKELYFNGPKAINEAKAKEVLAEIAKLEAVSDQYLQKEENERIDNLNQAYGLYKASFQEKYGLSERYLDQVMMKPSYYNKTPADNEKRSKQDLEDQFIELKKMQDAEEARIRLVRNACAGNGLLNAEHWVGQLQFMDVAQVLEAVSVEKARLAALENPAQETGQRAVDVDYEVVADDVPKLVIGTAEGIDFSSDFKERTKSQVFELVYPCDLGPSITELFKRLRAYGIKIRGVERQKARETVF